MGKITACPMETPTSMMVAHTTVWAAPRPMENAAPTAAPMSAMRTRLVRSASTATGSVQRSAAAPAMATMSRMPALVRWNASRMFGVRTLKALWVAWSSSSIPKSTPRGKRDTPAPSSERRLPHGASAGSTGPRGPGTAASLRRVSASTTQARRSKHRPASPRGNRMSTMSTPSPAGKSCQLGGR